MNRPMETAQSPLEYIDSYYPSSKDGCSEKHGNAPPGPAGTPGPLPDISLPGVDPHPHQHPLQPGMVDPFSLSFHYPCQSTQCPLIYPDYVLEPQLSPYHLLTSSVPGPPDSSHHSSAPAPAPWFAGEPILCSMMPGDFHTPAASMCVPQAADQQQFQEGLTDFTPHLMQPVVYNMSGEGQVVLANPCEPGPLFLTLRSAPAHTDSSPTQAADVSVSGFGAPSQQPQYHQTSCPLYESRDQTADTQPQAPPACVGTLCELKFRKPCHCTRSQCLKLYCECFANGLMCTNCDCSNCYNNAEHEMKRQKAIKSYLGRKPDAFRSKIAAGKSGEVKGWHNKGCNCKRSGCLKNYCECYEANIKCTSSCKCAGCMNCDSSSEKIVGVKKESPASVITPAVVEAVCGRLLAQAGKAEREGQSPSRAEHMVLEEFGHCLSQIVKAMERQCGEISGSCSQTAPP